MTKNDHRQYVVGVLGEPPILSFTTSAPPPHETAEGEATGFVDDLAAAMAKVFNCGVAVSPLGLAEERRGTICHHKAFGIYAVIFSGYGSPMAQKIGAKVYVSQLSEEITLIPANPPISASGSVLRKV